MKPAEVCREAVEILKRDGWYQGGWACETGEVCVQGALFKAAGGRFQPLVGSPGRMTIHDEDWDVWADLAEVRRALYVHLKEVPALWNDELALDVDEIIFELETLAEQFEREAVTV